MVDGLTYITVYFVEFHNHREMGIKGVRQTHGHVIRCWMKSNFNVLIPVNEVASHPAIFVFAFLFVSLKMYIRAVSQLLLSCPRFVHALLLLS